MGRCNVIKASTSRCLLFQEEVLWNCADPVSLAFLVHDSIEWLVRIDPRFNGATNFLLSPLNASSLVSPLYSNFTLSRHSYPRTWFIEPSKKKIPFQKIIILDFIFEFVLKKVSSYFLFSLFDIVTLKLVILRKRKDRWKVNRTPVWKMENEQEWKIEDRPKTKECWKMVRARWKIIRSEVSWKMGEWWGTGAGFIVDDRTMCQWPCGRGWCSRKTRNYSAARYRFVCVLARKKSWPAFWRSPPILPAVHVDVPFTHSNEPPPRGPRSTSCRSTSSLHRGGDRKNRRRRSNKIFARWIPPFFHVLNPYRDSLRKDFY